MITRDEMSLLLDLLKRANEIGYKPFTLVLSANEEVTFENWYATDIAFTESTGLFAFAINNGEWINQITPLMDIEKFPIYKIKLKDISGATNTIKFTAFNNPFKFN